MILLLLVGSLKEVTETTLGTFFTSWMEAWKVCLGRSWLGEESLGIRLVHLLGALDRKISPFGSLWHKGTLHLL